MNSKSCNKDESMESAISIHEFDELVKVLRLYSINGSIIESGEDLHFMANKPNLEKILSTSEALAKACRERLEIMINE
ncbi:hypothetical protein [Alteromonas antoniana]|uniref:hypothetical protein n=1 Tax=Alteromonas antoniana TaxID=2803813 RepID=UPI001C45A25E|nr:hypothetical protein [Alteromonas antoniana]